MRQPGIYKILRITAMLCALTLLTATAMAGNFTLVVSVPPTTPDNAEIFITGNHDFLGNWNGKGGKLKEIGPNLFEFSAEMPVGFDIEFKFTRGSFSNVEKTAQGHEVPNRKLRVAAGTPFNKRITVEAWADQVANPATKPVITGWYSMRRAVKSQYLEPARDLIIWLPPSYPRNKTLRYPVIYMHDGQNLFDANTAFGGIEWGVDEVMTEYIAGSNSGKLKEAIVVGIANTADRMSEYTPFVDPKHNGGNGEKYVKFVIEEVKPLIDEQFRTLPERDSTFIGGSSLGGLISLYAGVRYPQVFGGIIAMSPSIWWADGAIIDWLVKHDIAGYPGKIWVDMGTREGDEAITYSRKLAAEIAKKAPAFKNLHYREFSGATHSERSWRLRLHFPLQHIIGTAK
ncbi:MAG TPA: esterase [Candidatus Riflebacteria bacterium]|nr:esterase [Candidatus Riflebacteria bacterium]